MTADFKFEKRRWKQGFEFIAGVDEVGKGCFAGPVVAGCVVFRRRGDTSRGAPKPGFPLVGGFGADEWQDPESLEIKIDDSKKLKPRQREKAEKWIKENALAWGIGEASAGKINTLGMAKASRIAFRAAISDARKRLGRPIDFLLADAFFTSYVPGLPANRRKNKKGRFYKKITGRQEAIINGDEKSISIAAASIVAKVYRDKLMKDLGKKKSYKYYGWGSNKGYGTRTHREAILKHGLTRQHRKQYVKTWKTKLGIKD